MKAKNSNHLTIKCGSFGDSDVDAMHAAPLQDVAAKFAARPDIVAYGTRLCCRIFAGDMWLADFNVKDGAVEGFAFNLDAH